MCEDCGCTLNNIEHNHQHNIRTLKIASDLLSKNNQIAAENRQYFADHNLLVLNILSSPGAGKTALLERTIQDLQTEINCAVIVGDLATDNDAQRLKRVGAQAVQIATGNLCHLEAGMVTNALRRLDLSGVALLAIENVGNLVCPTAYDLGEELRIVLFSVTEGEDKSLKYPTTFKSANLVLINKIDLIKAIDYDRELALKNIQQIAPQAKILEISARTGEGMDNWYRFLREKLCPDNVYA
jgi:hydrogenase nickel incorporation protein HypB